MNGFKYGKNPYLLFKAWFRAATESQGGELASTMVLATVDKNLPSVRFVLFKGFVLSGKAFSFYTNFESRKAVELAKNPRASMAFYWAPLNRQVRIEGKIQKLSRKDSQKYFSSRARDSQIHAWASPQSAVLSQSGDAPWASRKFLEARVEAVAELVKEQKSLPCPAHWGGYGLVPDRIEFWQAGKNRLHYRVRFTWVRGRWISEELAP